jgi:hypothetical protein
VLTEAIPRWAATGGFGRTSRGRTRLGVPHPVAAALPAAVLPEDHLRSELRRRGSLVAHTVYECSVCGERSVGERRCAQDNVFCRGLGLGGRCSACDEPILLAELLELEVMPLSPNPQPSTEKGSPP